MKKYIRLFMLFFLLTGCSSSPSWAFHFIKYNNVNYIVTENEVKSSDLGGKIGEITHFLEDEQDSVDMSSNYYPKGTEFFEIKGIDKKEAIAVKENEKIIKLEAEDY